MLGEQPPPSRAELVGAALGGVVDESLTARAMLPMLGGQPPPSRAELAGAALGGVVGEQLGACVVLPMLGGQPAAVVVVPMLVPPFSCWARLSPLWWRGLPPPW